MTLWLCTTVNSESVSRESDQSYSRETYVSLTTIKVSVKEHMHTGFYYREKKRYML